jgi:hypothetical protein
VAKINISAWHAPNPSLNYACGTSLCEVFWESINACCIMEPIRDAAFCKRCNIVGKKSVCTYFDVIVGAFCGRVLKFCIVFA